MSEIATGIRVVLRRDQVRSHMKRAFDAANGNRECTAAMSESNTEVRESFKDTAENHGTDRKRCFSRHTDQPRQPIFPHALLAQHVPGMNKDRGVQFLSGAPHRLQRRVVEIQNIDATRMGIRIHMCADLRATHSQVPHASFQFDCGQIGILHGNGRKSREPLWMIANDLGDVVV